MRKGPVWRIELTICINSLTLQLQFYVATLKRMVSPDKHRDVCPNTVRRFVPYIIFEVFPRVSSRKLWTIVSHCHTT